MEYCVKNFPVSLRLLQSRNTAYC